MRSIGWLLSRTVRRTDERIAALLIAYYAPAIVGRGNIT